MAAEDELGAAAEDEVLLELVLELVLVVLEVVVVEDSVAVELVSVLLLVVLSALLELELEAGASPAVSDAEPQAARVRVKQEAAVRAARVVRAMSGGRLPSSGLSSPVEER